MIVVDASCLVHALLRFPGSAAAIERLFERGDTLHAPYLIDAEVAHVVRRQAMQGHIGAALGGWALQQLGVLPMERYAHGPLLSRLWSLRENLSAYDAIYVALAERLDAPLVTRDRRLAAAPGHRARIEVI